MDSGLSSSFVELLMECKSKKIYDKWFEKYSQFCCEKKLKINQFTSFMEFIVIISKNYVVSRIWQAASCANKNLTLKYGSNFMKESVFKLNKEYVPTKSSTLSLGNVFDFVVSTSNSEEFLSVNVPLILRNFGELRVSEIVAFNFEDVEFKVNYY